MFFDPKSKSNLSFMTNIAQLNHFGYIIAVLSFLIWGFTSDFMKGNTENDKNKKLIFFIAIILFIGIACLIKVNIVQVMRLAQR